MRVMVIIKANADSEAGKLPSERLLREMTAYNEELVKAGLMLGGEGLHPSSRGVRLSFDNDGVKVTPGPFGDPANIMAGYWMLRVSSLDEAVEWIRRVPNPDGLHQEIEIRQVLDAADFGDNFTPDLQQREADLRSRTGGG